MSPYSAQDFYELLKHRMDGPPIDDWRSGEACLRRAAFAAEALAMYGRRTKEAGESVFLVMQDLLTDLRHLVDVAKPANSDGYSKDFDDLVSASTQHYVSEVPEGQSA